MVFHDVGMSLAWTNLFTFVRNKPLNIYSMQKLKLFLLFFVATVAACNFTSCKDDDNVSSAIVGTWIGGDEYGRRPLFRMLDLGWPTRIG